MSPYKSVKFIRKIDETLYCTEIEITVLCLPSTCVLMKTYVYIFFQIFILRFEPKAILRVFFYTESVIKRFSRLDLSDNMLIINLKVFKELAIFNLLIFQNKNLEAGHIIYYKKTDVILKSIFHSLHLNSEHSSND